MKNTVAIFMMALIMISLFTLALDVSPVRASETPLQGNLAGYWGFDEGSGGTAADSSGNGNTGTLTNNPAWVDGRSGEALSFDGVDDYVRVEASSSLDVTSQVTVETWVYPRAYVDSTGMASHIISRCASSGGHIYVLGMYPDSSKVSFSVNPYPPTQPSAADLPLNAWTHLAMTYDGSYVRLYINGDFDSSYAQSGSIITTNNWLAIACKPTGPGGGSGTYAYFNGVVDDVRIYNRALSQQEIQSDMNGGTYDVTFSETGLPSGYPWSVVLEGSCLYVKTVSTSTLITFVEVPSGTYEYSVGAIGFTGSPASAPIVVDKPGISESVAFSVYHVSVAEWNYIEDSYSFDNYGTDFLPYLKDRGVCYGMASTALLYFMRYSLGGVYSDYPVFPLQSPRAENTADLVVGDTSKLNNVSLAIMLHQCFCQNWRAPGSDWERMRREHPGDPLHDRQYTYLLGNLTMHQPVVLILYNDNINVEGSHAVVAWKVDLPPGNLDPDMYVGIHVYDPNHHQEDRIAIYNLSNRDFSFSTMGHFYDYFYVANPTQILPPTPVTPSNYYAPVMSWGGWNELSMSGYSVIIADKEFNVTDQSSGLADRFTDWGNSQSFVCDIPKSSGIQEGNVQVIAIPHEVSYRVDDPGSGQATFLIACAENQSGQFVESGYFLNVTTMQGSLNYTVTPSNSSLLVSAGDTALNVSITFFSATQFGHSIAQVPTVQVDATQTVNVTRPSPTVIMEVASSKDFVGQGFSAGLNVTVINVGSATETVTFTVYANGAIIKTYTNLTLGGNSTTILSLAWNTTGFAMGNYTINAYVELGAGGTLSCFSTSGCLAEVTIPGDSDGDRDVDIFDIVRMAGGYGTLPPNPKYNINCDIDGDDDIDIFDIVIAAGHYGDSW